MPWRSAAVQAALNALDGWSTNAAIDTSFTPADRSCVDQRQLGEDHQALGEPDDQGAREPIPNYLPVGATSPVAGVLTYGTDFTADVSPDVDSGGKFLRITR